jgi:hypothetical protein
MNGMPMGCEKRYGLQAQKKNFLFERCVPPAATHSPRSPANNDRRSTPPLCALCCVVQAEQRKRFGASGQQVENNHDGPAQ